MSYYITDFSHIRPLYEVEQKCMIEWLARLHASAAQKAGITNTSYAEIKTQLADLETKIHKRGMQIEDPLPDLEKTNLYAPHDLPEGQSLGKRMAFFDEQTSLIFEQFYPEGTKFPSQLIHVTCTGYVAPSAAQKITSRRKAESTTVTHAYHMGCYAALPAIRIAAGALSLPFSTHSYSDIVHTELCSIHLDPLQYSTEQLIIQSLFADGFIKYSVHKDPIPKPHFTILALLEEIIPDSLESMSWRCDALCHTMSLSKEVPRLITRALKKYLSCLCKQARVDEETILSHAYFAVHPGGVKILHHVQNLLELELWQLNHSIDVLHKYGNMSSATLPHIWEEMLIDPKVPANAYVVSMAFGPGLTIAGSLFQKCTP